MPTRAETTINHATVESGGQRVFYRGDSGLPQFRVTPAAGGYFMEDALGAGRWWNPRAYALTDSGLNADLIPAGVWDDRQEMAAAQAEAFKALGEADVKPDVALRDLRDLADSDDRAVRKAATALIGLRFILVWPEEEVAKAISAYQGQWAEDANRAEV